MAKLLDFGVASRTCAMRCRSSRSMPRPSSSRIWFGLAERLFHLGEDCRFQIVIGGQSRRLERARHAENRIEVGLGRQAELRGRGRKA